MIDKLLEFVGLKGPCMEDMKVINTTTLYKFTQGLKLGLVVGGLVVLIFLT